MVCYLLNLLKSIHPNLKNEENHFSIGVNSSLQPFKFFFKLVERCRGKMQYQTDRYLVLVIGAIFH
jgi:hypothetical protein